jgi:hypothetical protein
MICKFSAYAAPIIECNLDSPSGSRHRVGTVIQALTLSTECRSGRHLHHGDPSFQRPTPIPWAADKVGLTSKAEVFETSALS